jgi:hypothetical protein
MTDINVTTSVVYVDVTNDGLTTVVQSPSAPVVIDVVTPGPQGAFIPQKLANLEDMDVTGLTDQAVVYYSSVSAKFRADGTNTILSLTDGGNF